MKLHKLQATQRNDIVISRVFSREKFTFFNKIIKLLLHNLEENPDFLIVVLDQKMKNPKKNPIRKWLKIFLVGPHMFVKLA